MKKSIENKRKQLKTIESETVDLDAYLSIIDTANKLDVGEIQEIKDSKTIRLLIEYYLKVVNNVLKKGEHKAEIK